MRSLVLLAAASAASAASVPLKSFFPRQSTCSDSATSAWGTDWNVYCNTNQMYGDWNPNSQDDSNNPGQNITDCINQCSSLWGPCGGVVFIESTNMCWFKNSTFAYVQASSQQQNGTTLAVPKQSEYTSSNTTCPYDNGSVQQSSQSQNFTIHCNQDISGDDMIPQGVTSGVGYPYHTTTLAECMDMCTSSTPVCQGVAWNPDIEECFSNCYFKANDGQYFLYAPRSGTVGIEFNGMTFQPVVHSASAYFSAISDNFTNGEMIDSTASNKTQYTLTVDQNMAGNDISQFHTTSLQTCVTACDQLTASHCVGVVFDTTYKSGWNNCWLKSAIGTPQTDDAGYIWATSNGTAPGKKSLAWVAGPVIGVIILIAVAVWFFLWRRNRRNLKGPSPKTSYTPIEQQQHAPWSQEYKQGAYADVWNGAQAQHHYPVELSPQTERNHIRPAELSPSTAKPHELAGGSSPVASELPAMASPTVRGTPIDSPLSSVRSP